DTIEDWDHFPFHDRDFTSVAELLLVPGCPPGLFTKQFVENPPSASFPAFNPLTTPPSARPASPSSGAVLNAGPHTYPYLVDNFYYSADNVPPPTDPTTVNVIGGPTGAGWFRALDFFEVPSTALGAIGTADRGQNFDWYRQDRKPGLLNLNLIIDEEVFFGLVDDPRLNLNLAFSSSAVPRICTG